ncbi:CAAX prenyl protease 1-like protein, partial [Armadillidium vulgare]
YNYNFKIVKYQYTNFKSGNTSNNTHILVNYRAVEVSDITMFFPIGEYDPNTPVTLSNTFTMGIATLPTPSLKSLKESCSEKVLKFPYFERLQAVKREFDVVKGEPIILSIKWAAFLMALVLPSFLSQIIFRPSGKTISVSNVPGPLTDVYMVGKRIKEIRFWVPDNSPNGAGFTFISYKGKLRVSFNVDTA